MDLAGGIGAFGIWFVVFLFTLTVHEAAHAFVAHLGGDDTAYRGGQVSLNPVPHIRREPIGTILVPILTFFTSGWMMGWASAPYDPRWGERHPRRLAAMSAAGPGANLILAILGVILIKGYLAVGAFAAPGTVNQGSRLVVAAPGVADGSLLHALAFFLSVLVNLNLLLFLFNLIPLPPLDGAGIVQGLMPDTAGRLLRPLAANPTLSLLGLFIAWRVFGVLHEPAFAMLLKVLYPGIGYS
jgi:Zn-dependent protease